jgi:hypothetical protein
MRRKVNEGKGKKTEQKQSKANTSHENKREQKNKEKIKLHFTCWESNPPPLSHLTPHNSHLQPPTPNLTAHTIIVHFSTF